MGASCSCMLLLLALPQLSSDAGLMAPAREEDGPGCACRAASSLGSGW